MSATSRFTIVCSPPASPADGSVLGLGDVGMRPAQLREFRERLVRLRDAALKRIVPEADVVTPARNVLETGRTEMFIIASIRCRSAPARSRR